MRKSGNITVFTALCLMLVASLLFALLEAGRVRGLSAVAEMKSSLAVESVCAEYQPGLWERYHLLCLDGAYGGEEFSMENVTGVLKARVDQNFRLEGEGSNLFCLVLREAAPEAYELMTDQEGAVFLERVAEYMKENFVAETVETLCEKYEEGAEVEESEAEEDDVGSALDALDEAKKDMETGEGTSGEDGSGETAPGEAASPELGEQGGEADVPAEEGTGGTPDRTQEEEEAASSAQSLLDLVAELKQNAVLGMVVDVGSVSGRKVDGSDCLLERTREQGISDEEREVDLYEKALSLEYLGKYFSDYTKTEGEHALLYEAEYVLCGKETDKENLEGTVEKLLLLREAANVMHIAADAEKKSEASALATALAGFTGNPVIVKIVEAGIIAAWAYLESVQDVRALMQGDKIALIKSREQWTVQLDNLAESFTGNSKAKNCSDGLSYQAYVKQLLYTLDTEKLAYRMMDVMERNVRLESEYGNCRMDHMIGSMDYSMQYVAEPLFAGFSVIGSLEAGEFLFPVRKSFSY